MPLLFANPARRFVAVESGQADVEQDHLGLKRRRHFYRFESIVGDVNFVAGRLQQYREAVCRVPVVLHDQDPTRDRRQCLNAGRLARHGR